MFACVCITYNMQSCINACGLCDDQLSLIPPPPFSLTVVTEEHIIGVHPKDLRCSCHDRIPA